MKRLKILLLLLDPIGGILLTAYLTSPTLVAKIGLLTVSTSPPDTMGRPIFAGTPITLSANSTVPGSSEAPPVSTIPAANESYTSDFLFIPALYKVHSASHKPQYFYQVGQMVRFHILNL